MSPAPHDARSASPEILRAAEREAARARRLVVGVPEDAPAIGLALSGGGIRSATFALGLLQALAAAKLLPRIDYLSTVSGGGYIGAFLGSLFVAQSARIGTTDATDTRADAARAADTLTAPRSWEMTWLRDNGRYLAPNGASDLVMAAAIALRNWLSIHVVLGLTFWALFLGLGGLGRALVVAWPRVVDGTGLSRLPQWAGLHAGAAGLIAVNPLLPLVIALVVGWLLPAGWAYWLVPDRGERLARRILPGAVAAFVAVCGTAVAIAAGGGIAIAGAALAACALLALIHLAGALIAARGRRAEAARNRLSRSLSSALVATAVVGAFALVIGAGEALYERWSEVGGGATGGVGLLALVAALLRSPLGKLISAPAALRRLPVPIIALGVGLGLVAIVLVLLAAAAHAVAAMTTIGVHGLVFLAVALIAVAFGHIISFLNRSSQAQLYGSRLARAYLGATNLRRQASKDFRINQPVAGDDIAWAEYRPDRAGGPLHLVNLTMNETVYAKTQMTERDRKGMNLCFGPCGVSVGVSHHATWQAGAGVAPRLVGVAKPGFAVFPPRPLAPEALTLAHAVGISGAAVSTGLGSRTSLGLSLLIGLFNLRLGHWWSSGVPEGGRDDATARTALNVVLGWFRRLMPVQTHLLDEFLARFPGPTSARWYLSDGGHFENTAAYELIRRELPLIIISDAGQDVDHRHDDLAGLVRKARIDFGCDIAFLSDVELDAAIGAGAARRRYASLRRAPPEAVAAMPPRPGYATLARLRYASGAIGTLVVIKPCVMGDESLDLIAYAASHATFPHESTGDQFFDEAQWEAYRKLGESIGAEIFGVGGDQPAWLRAPGQRPG